MNTIKVSRIVAMDIRESHPDKKAYQTDAYYANLANLLLDDFKKLRLNLGKQTASIMKYSAMLLANYMEDIVADSGQWRAFSELCQQMFGQDVPMFHDDDNEYYPDEPSYEAVRFFVWHAAIEMDDIWWNADDSSLKLMAIVAYDRLETVFEQSPINDELTNDINNMLKQAGEDFHKLRLALIWVLNGCYLTRSYETEKLLEKRMEESQRMKYMMSEESMRKFYALMHSIFAYKIGALALEPKEYLAAMMRTKAMSHQAQEVMEIEALPLSYYKYTIEDGGQWLQLLRTNGQILRVERSEITLDDEQLRSHDGCCGIFVKYLGSWHMNGIMFPIQDTASHWEELVKEDPDYLPEGQIDLTGEMLLEQTGGKEILYFKDLKEMESYLMKHLRYQPADFDFLKGQDLTGKNPMLFIDKNAKKFALHFSFGFTPCIADPDNPYYDATVASEKAIEMFWNDQSISKEAMLYLLQHNYVPDIYNDALFCQDNSLNEKQADALFLLRYMRKDKY